MAIKTRPPIYATKARPLHPKLPAIRRWVCDADKLQIAKFQNRRQPRLTAVIHRSTKHAGGWQVTWFDDGAPTGDFQETDCTRALRELHPSTWRLRSVRGR